MNENILHVIDSFPDLKVLVIGEAMLDSYLEGHSDRLCREAPVPVVEIQDREHVPGGAANTAVNVTSMGGNAYFLSVVGDDPEGETLCRSLETHGVSTENVLRTTGRSTLAKQRVIARQQMVVRFDQGTTDDLSPKMEEVLIRRMDDLFPQMDAIIVSDYNYGIFTPRVIDALAELQNRYPHLVVVDSKRLFEFRKINITAVKPNYKEALSLLGVERPVADTKNGRVKQMEQEGKRLLELLSTQILVITLDHDGALVFEQGQVPYRTYAKQQPNSKAAGAGDTFVSALTLSLASGLVTENAAELASAAASIVVNKDGTSACYADELRSFFSTGEKVVTDVFQLAGRMASYRRDNKQVVFTNGCFDILHRGHINYLNRAKSQGDILIVGVNSDEGVRRLKGPSRPINSLEDRAQILAALSCVDHIVPFDADTPHDLIRVIKPDIFVKGGDYTRETLPEASLVEELGGEVRILPYLDDHSTTGIIEKIRKLYAESPTETA